MLLDIVFITFITARYRKFATRDYVCNLFYSDLKPSIKVIFSVLKAAQSYQDTLFLKFIKMCPEPAVFGNFFVSNQILIRKLYWMKQLARLDFCVAKKVYPDRLFRAIGESSCLK